MHDLIFNVRFFWTAITHTDNWRAHPRARSSR